MKLLSFLVGLTILALSALAPTPAAAANPGAALGARSSLAMDRDRNAIFDDLDAKLRGAGDSERLPVIAVFDRAPSGSLIASQKATVGDFGVFQTYPSIGGYAAEMTKSQILALARRPEVLQIEEDRKVGVALDTSRSEFGVDKAVSDFGVSGDAAADGPKVYSPADVVIAVLDTGIDAGHADLDGGKVIAFQDCARTGGCMAASPSDGNGHGTHVASIAAGEGDGDSAYRGVAPGAALVGVKVLSDNGSGYISWINAGLEWAIANKATYGIDIINMSLGASGSSDGTDSMAKLVNKATAAGISTFVAAGNEGPGALTIGTPAAAKFAVTVGAMADPKNTSGSRPPGFYLADFSSRGPTADGRQKPDIAASGVDVAAAKAGTAGSYVNYSGTSMATPFAAGVAALMIHANPALVPSGTACATGDTSAECSDGVVDSTMQNPLKSALIGTAQDWGSPGGDSESGAGRLDAYAAIDAASILAGRGGPPVPPRSYNCGTLSGTGDVKDFPLHVSSLDWPVTASLIMSSWIGSSSPDFGIELISPSGSLLAQTTTQARQDTLSYKPALAGTYKVRAFSSSGSGDFLLDVSGMSVIQLIESGGSTNVTEGGAPDTYGVALSSQPSTDVTVSIAPDAQLTVSVSSLAFTPTNWSTPQEVTVSAVNDALVEGSHTAVVGHTIFSSDGNCAYSATGLNLDISEVSSIDNDPRHPDGTLIKGSSPTIYYLEAGRKRHVPNAAVFESRFRWSEIISVRDSELTIYPDGAALGFREGALIGIPDGRIWAISNGVRRHIKSESAFLGLGYSWSSVRWVSFEEGAVNSDGDPIFSYTGTHPDGALMKGSGSTVYLLEASRRSRVSSAPVFESWFGWNEIVRVSDGELGIYADGPSMGFRDGTLIHTPDGRVWAISNGQRRHIVSEAAFNSLGYSWLNVRYVSDAEGSLHPIGPSIG